jgi:hypothetical protein
MNQISSKRSIKTERNFWFYFAVFFIVIIFFGLFGAGLSASSLSETPPIYWALLSSLGSFAFGIYSVYRLYRLVPSVRVFDDGMRIRRRHFNWGDIAEIFFTGKQPFKYVSTTPVEGAMLLFKDGTKIFLYDSMYTNLWKIKAAVKKALETAGQYDQLLTNAGYPPSRGTLANQTTQPLSATDVEMGEVTYFRGNQLLNFNGIVLWFVLVCIAVVIIVFDNSVATVFLTLVAIGWFLFVSSTLHYFGVSDKCIIVRNHNLFWKKKVYRLTDIDSVECDFLNSSANSFAIFLKNLQMRRFLAPTLHPQDWVALIQLLESKNILIRDGDQLVATHHAMQQPAVKRKTRQVITKIIISAK